MTCDNFYTLDKTDVNKAGKILASAFSDDPLFGPLFEGLSFDQRSASYECPIKQSITYGMAFAPSKELEGICTLVYSDYVHINLWRAIRCGLLSSVKKIGNKNMLRFNPVFSQMELWKKQYGKNKKYIYIPIIGVQPKFQRQGIGKKLLQFVIDKSEKENLPIFLETETEENVKIYESFGFKALDKTIISSLNKPFWVMIRQTSKTCS